MLRFLPSIAVMLSTIVVAAPVTTVSERDGYKFEYTSVLTADGKVLLDGQMLPSHEKFNLVVMPDAQVVGEVGERPVDFEVSRRQRNRLVAGLMHAEQTAMPVDSAPATIAGR